MCVEIKKLKLHTIHKIHTERGKYEKGDNQMTTEHLQTITDLIDSMSDKELKQAMQLQKILVSMTQEQRADFQAKVNARLQELDRMEK